MERCKKHEWESPWQTHYRIVCKHCGKDLETFIKTLRKEVLREAAVLNCLHCNNLTKQNWEVTKDRIYGYMHAGMTGSDEYLPCQSHNLWTIIDPENKE